MKSSTFVTHVFAAGAGIYGLKCSSLEASLPTIAYSLITLHNALGVLKYVMEDNNLDEAYDWTRFLQHLFPFPCIVGQLWLLSGGKSEYAYIHPLVSIVPLMSKLMDQDFHRARFINNILLANAISGLYVSIIPENWFGVATILAFALTFGINQEVKTDEINTGVGISTILSYFGLGFLKM